MPVRGSDLVIDDEVERRKQLILKKIQDANDKKVVQNFSSDEEEEDHDEEIRRNSIKEYKCLINQTLDLPLEKLILTPEGVDIFDELCLRLDVNQKYAELLPQWKDVAHHLQVDDLSTKWVEVCVRPREGLTRAMLEIYMRDGGTLGEVLEALLDLQCLDILEEIKPKIDTYSKKKDAGELVPKANFMSNDNFFSVIKTLIMAFGNQDPCQDLYKFANGLKTFDTNPGLEGEMEHTGVVQSAAEVLNNDCWPRYTSELHLNKLDQDKNDEKEFKVRMSKKVSCKILLLFAEDGVTASQVAIDISKTMEHEVTDFFSILELQFN